MALVVATYSVNLCRFLGFDQFVPFSWIVFCIECGIVRLATISVIFLVLLGSHLSSSLVFGFCVIMDGALLGGREGEITNNKWKCNSGWWHGLDLIWVGGLAKPILVEPIIGPSWEVISHFISHVSKDLGVQDHQTV